MKQVFAKKGKVEVEEVTSPLCNDGEIKVRVYHSAISVGTEIGTIKNVKQPLYKIALKRKDLVKKVIKRAQKEGYIKTYKHMKQMIDSWWSLGYSCAGEVIEVGKNITNFSIGDLVACAGQNIANHSEIVCVPKNLAVKIPDEVSLKEACYTTIGSIAIQGVRRLNTTFGETIVVIGLGLIGQITCMVLESAGCRAIGIDIDERRANITKAHKIFTKDALKSVMSYTNNIGVDGVIITAASQNESIINEAMEMCRKKGRVVLVGKVPININYDIMYKKELDFFISGAYGPGRYDPGYEIKGNDYPIGYVRWTENRNMQEFLRLLFDKRISVKHLIEKEYDIDNAAEAYDSLNKDSPKPLSVILNYPTGKKEEIKHILTSNREVKGKINVALIGVGNFAKGTHLLNIKGIKDFNLRAVVTKSPGSAKNTAKSNRAEYCTTDYTEVLNDDKINLVIISTRHNLHAKISNEAISKGKHVLVEKPMGMNRKECNEILKLIDKKDLVYSVGFNRNYAPFTQKIKSFFKNRDYPLIINYRVNTRPTGNEDWINDPEEGGGRIIGELCHMFSFFDYIINSKVSNISASKIKSNGKVIDDNNIATTINYKDGSVANLVCTDYANDSLAKERIEIFGGRNAIVIDDFEKLNINGKISKSKQDKGHYCEILELKKKLQGKRSELTDVNHAYRVMEVCFRIKEILSGQDWK